MTSWGAGVHASGDLASMTIICESQGRVKFFWRELLRRGSAPRVVFVTDMRDAQSRIQVSIDERSALARGFSALMTGGAEDGFRRGSPTTAGPAGRRRTDFVVRSPMRENPIEAAGWEEFAGSSPPSVRARSNRLQLGF